MSRNAELENLHPVVRNKVITLTEHFSQENLPFRMFEGFRTPQRQQNLFDQGRTKPGRIVTKAPAWSSYHQYGVAADFVLYVDGKWSWSDKGKFKNAWKRLHELANTVGLKPLSWERPHLQLIGISLAQLKAGNYPDGGDESWSENLHNEIVNWRGSFKPPLPAIHFSRPEIEFTAETVDESDDADITNTNTASPQYFSVNARNGLRMRAGPGTSFDIITTLSNGQMVQVISKTGQWCQVDLQGDGIADGYCHTGFLR